MIAEELRAYVDSAGGVEAFAALVKIKPRYVYMLLAGQRTMSERLDNLIRLTATNR
jgi:hypothetical protein